jgi:hypothetical protein
LQTHPSAFSTSTFSWLIFSGSVMIMRYPFSAAASARPMPVLPLVGSISVSPGFMRPSASAISTMRSPIRSFTLPPAEKNSHFATSSQRRPADKRLMRTQGVPPTKSSADAEMRARGAAGLCA